jgi:hypothetical protein
MHHSNTHTHTHTPAVIYNTTHKPPLKIPAMWGLVFLVVNGTMIISLLLGEQEVAFTQVKACVCMFILWL